MIKLEMRNGYMILTEKHQKYQCYREVKPTNTNFLPVKKSCHLRTNKVYVFPSR